MLLQYEVLSLVDDRLTVRVKFCVPCQPPNLEYQMGSLFSIVSLSDGDGAQKGDQERERQVRAHRGQELKSHFNETN